MSAETCRAELKRLINEKVVESCLLFTSLYLSTVNRVCLTIFSIAKIICVREEKVLQGMTDYRLAEVEIRHTMETNVQNI